MNWQKFERFSQKINERILRQWQQTYLEKLLCLLQVFFLTRINGGKIETTSRKTQCPVPEYSPGPCVRKIVLVGVLWTLKFLCRNLQIKWCCMEKKLSAIFSEPFRPVLCKLDMTSLYSWWMTTKCLQFDSRLCESNIIMHLQLQFTSHFDCFKEWTNGPNI